MWLDLIFHNDSERENRLSGCLSMLYALMNQLKVWFVLIDIWLIYVDTQDLVPLLL